MANGKKIGAFVILSILALGGLGLSGYMFIEDLLLGKHPQVHDYEGYQMVAVWEELHGTGSAFNLSLDDMTLNYTEFFSLTDDNVSLTLEQRGWYKFTFITTWTSLDSLNTYYFRVHKNENIIGYAGTFTNPQETIRSLNLVYYVYSVGNDTFRFHCHSSGADVFSVATNQDFNQVVLEYCRV